LLNNGTKAGVSNSNCFGGEIGNYQVTRSNVLYCWHNNGGTWTLLETACTFYFLRKVSWVVRKSFLTLSMFV